MKRALIHVAYWALSVCAFVFVCATHEPSPMELWMIASFIYFAWVLDSEVGRSA